ncbi:outer membrane protein OmpA-like peptidoglycan-associated protein [Larkinella arboricola]|uniref:Outer membrane protein OmpA-like peptidoglycan-associated protein n=1 Tax=Larkinella arboricola TaxID=643671 RepID=A0A327X6T3_LARAB|nr:OmpA family protein [Larkinella arboricola]RAK01908.1 outer membrane protein OmpA-like peptidoglycan-associated protein [Larkinella arboricola]
MKQWFLILWFACFGMLQVAQAQKPAPKIVQRDYDPPQRNVRGGGKVVKVEYTNHKMIVFFVAEDRDEAQRATIYGPGHPNCWRLFDTKSNQEYALLYIRNIKADGELVESILDEPRGIRLRDVRTITCEAHFERPGKNVRSVNLIEQDVERYEGRVDPRDPFGGVSSQWPYNVYDLRVMVYRDDLSNARPPVRKTPAKPGVKTTRPPAQKPAPKAVPSDSVVAQKPPKVPAKPAPAEKVENFGSNVETGRTYRLNNLLFKQSAYEIEPESYPELDSLVALMNRNPIMEIELSGHTDNVGDPKLNVALSQKRVDAVKSYLVNKGIQSERIQTRAYGGSKPLADNSREETRRLNRRVEVTILK